jgi:hypothetical protein
MLSTSLSVAFYMFCRLEYKYSVGTYLLVVLDILLITHTRLNHPRIVLTNSRFIYYILIRFDGRNTRVYNLATFGIYERGLLGDEGDPWMRATCLGPPNKKQTSTRPDCNSAVHCTYRFSFMLRATRLSIPRYPGCTTKNGEAPEVLC